MQTKNHRLSEIDFHELFSGLGLDIANFSTGHGKCDCGKRDVDIFILTTKREQEIIFPNRRRVRGQRFSIGNDCAFGFVVV